MTLIINLQNLYNLYNNAMGLAATKLPHGLNMFY